MQHVTDGDWVAPFPRNQHYPPPPFKFLPNPPLPPPLPYVGKSMDNHHHQKPRRKKVRIKIRNVLNHSYVIRLPGNTHREISKSYEIKPKSDCIYHFLVDLEIWYRFDLIRFRNVNHSNMLFPFQEIPSPYMSSIPRHSSIIFHVSFTNPAEGKIC